MGIDSRLNELERSRRVGPRKAIWVGDRDCYVYIQVSDDIESVVLGNARTGQSTQLLVTKERIKDLHQVEKNVRFDILGSLFEISETGEIYSIDKAPGPIELRPSRWVGDRPLYEQNSPDGEMIASLRNNSLIIINKTRTHIIVEVSCKENETWNFGEWSWSPNSQTFAAITLDYQHVPRYPVLYWLGDKERVEFEHQTRTGDSYPVPRLFLLHRSGQVNRIELPGCIDQIILTIGWFRDSREFAFIKTNRIMDSLSFIVAPVISGTLRELWNYKSTSFIEGLRLHEITSDLFFELNNDSGFVWLSEQTGWHAIWHYQRTGELERVVEIKGLEIRRVIQQVPGTKCLFVMGQSTEYRPYDLHLFAVDMDTSSAKQLTAAPGQHFIDIAPSGDFFLDIHASMTSDPVIHLCSSEGICLLQLNSYRNDYKNSKVAIHEIVSSAADGSTELWGTLVRPALISKENQIPLVDYIYNGPFITWAPRTRYEAEQGFARNLAEKGIAVLIVDGRGTPERGKAFQDVVFQSFGVHEIPDHFTVLNKVCEQYDFIDRGRVGIFGGSWGGYMTIRALLMYPDVYKVGVATNPVTNLFDHPAMAIEPYMGLPTKNIDGYLAASNIENATKLNGKLLIIHGSADKNAPLINTMKMAAALTTAGKKFDLQLMPDQGHSFEGPMRAAWLRLIIEYFEDHL